MTTLANSCDRTILVNIQRTEPADRCSFRVRATDPVTVLDLLRDIQQIHDPSLGFRYSCRVAMCGTCGVRVNRRSALACRWVVRPECDEVEVAPLSGLPVTRDLIVDMRRFWEEWKRVLPWFVPGGEETKRVPPESGEADLVESALGCITCGACYSTCEIARHQSDYLGPAALNRALALIADPRDGAAAERLRIVGSRSGVDRCHYVQACSSACPVGLDPSESIARLRRLRLLVRNA